MYIPTAGPPIAYKWYQILLKSQKFMDEQIILLVNVGCISKGLSLLAAQ